MWTLNLIFLGVNICLIAWLVYESIQQRQLSDEASELLKDIREMHRSTRKDLLKASNILKETEEIRNATASFRG